MIDPHFPFSQEVLPTIASLSEDALLARIRQQLGDRTPPAPQGMGDDCASLSLSPNPGVLLLTTDSLTWGIHFDASASPQAAGAKLLKRNLSDIAAMAGTPAHALLNLQSGPDLRIDWLESFIEGLAASAREWEVSIVGGDLSSLPHGIFTASLTLVGFSEKPVTRSTASIGDSLYVTGHLGGSLHGHHLSFTPRVAEASWLAANAPLTALMDLSDGLGTDLPRMLQLFQRARLDPATIPLSPTTQEMTLPERLQSALFDGEDYELLFTAPAADQSWLNPFQAQFPCLPVTCIGFIDTATEEESGRLFWQDGGLCEGEGFRHFKA
ncbi:MAG: thiamine-monophosphate kinase [Puniceicoccaceae bacterium]